MSTTVPAGRINGARKNEKKKKPDTPAIHKPILRSLKRCSSPFFSTNKPIELN
ncbi:MAG: hypothetical protein MG2_0641 [uncultured Candidatus Poseidoniales archaeon]|nr:MAG: hypothetical protein MG2_0641 [uncultured Candidatus Poseidoniales archaeon]